MNQILNSALNPLHRILRLILISFGLVSSTLSAATIDDLQFTLINDGTEYSVSAVDATSIAGEVNVPATYNGKPVTHVNQGAFISANQLTSVVLPDSITTIGATAFASCRSLTSIVLPNSITEIGLAAFENCAFTSVVLPNSLTTISSSLFTSCPSLSSIVLPNSLTTIGESAFYNCNSLTSIEFPASLTTIEVVAFKNSYNLNSMTFLGSAPTLGTRAFEDTGGGDITITIYDTHEASYDSWRSLYTFDVVPGPVIEPVVYYAQISYDPSSSYLSITTESDPETVPLDLQHKADLQSAWTIINTGDYEKVTDTNSNSVTRTVLIDTATNPSGFYRLSSEQEL
jgi:hypothetical protein